MTIFDKTSHEEDALSNASSQRQYNIKQHKRETVDIQLFTIEQKTSHETEMFSSCFECRKSSDQSFNQRKFTPPGGLRRRCPFFFLHAHNIITCSSFYRSAVTCMQTFREHRTSGLARKYRTRDVAEVKDDVRLIEPGHANTQIRTHLWRRYFSFSKDVSDGHDPRAALQQTANNKTDLPLRG